MHIKKEARKNSKLAVNFTESDRTAIQTLAKHYNVAEADIVRTAVAALIKREKPTIENFVQFKPQGG